MNNITIKQIVEKQPNESNENCDLINTIHEFILNDENCWVDVIRALKKLNELEGNFKEVTRSDVEQYIKEWNENN